MLTKPTNWDNYISDPSHYFETVIRVGNSEYDYDDIFSLTASLNLYGDEYSVGGVCMNQYDAVLYGVTANAIPKYSTVSIWTRLCVGISDTVTIPKCRMRGDVDGDGQWTSQGENSDVQIALEAISSGEYADEIQRWTCHTNSDTVADPRDVSNIGKMANGNLSQLSEVALSRIQDYYGNWTFNTTTHKWGITLNIPTSQYMTLPSWVTEYVVSGNTIRITATNPPIADSVITFSAKTSWIPKGVFYTKKPTYDPESETVTITGYDAMHLTEQVPFGVGSTITTWNNPSLREVASLIVNGTQTAKISSNWGGIGIQLEDATQVSNTLTMTAPPYGYTVREILKDIAIACGGNWTIAFSGTYPNQVSKLRLVPINELPTYTFNLLADESDNVLLFGDLGIIV